MEALLSLSSELQHLGVCFDDRWRQQQACSTLRRFIRGYLELIEKDTSCPHGNVQRMWDVLFLQRLERLWSEDADGTSKRIDTSVARYVDVGTSPERQTFYADNASPYRQPRTPDIHSGTWRSRLRGTLRERRSSWRGYFRLVVSHQSDPRHRSSPRSPPAYYFTAFPL